MNHHQEIQNQNPAQASSKAMFEDQNKARQSSPPRSDTPAAEEFMQAALEAIHAEERPWIRAAVSLQTQPKQDTIKDIY